jgi:hypothetical protein
MTSSLGLRDESGGDYPSYPFVAHGSAFKKLRSAGCAMDINDHGDIVGVEYGVGWDRILQRYAVTGRAGKIWSRADCASTCCQE